MKKIISSILALAMFVSVGVMMVGCDEVSGKTYENTDRIYTVITKVEDGKVTETKDLTFDEYYKVDYVWNTLSETALTLDEALEYELDEEGEEIFQDYLSRKDFKRSRTTVSFKNGKFTIVMENRANSLNSQTSRREVYGTYVEEDGRITLKQLVDADVYEDMADYKAYSLASIEYEVNEDTISYVQYRSAYRDLDEDHEFSESDVFSYSHQTEYYYTNVFTLVK